MTISDEMLDRTTAKFPHQTKPLVCLAIDKKHRVDLIKNSLRQASNDRPPAAEAVSFGPL